MKVGIDLVYIPDFEKNLKTIKPEDVFTATELEQNSRVESFAGIFAAKEAFFKAIGKKLTWIDVWIEKNDKGKPILYSTVLKNEQKAEVSIAHDKDYATAIVVIDENTD